jgi:hypothetical protein
VRLLPYKKMLIVTGVMIGAVLLIMVGNTVHVLQVVGWLPLHPIRSIQLPYWTGMWFGLYATWEGLALQVVAAVFVIGSYVLAERVQGRQRRAQNTFLVPSSSLLVAFEGQGHQRVPGGSRTAGYPLVTRNPHTMNCYLTGIAPTPTPRPYAGYPRSGWPYALAHPSSW